MGNSNCCASMRDNGVILEELKVPTEARECLGCHGLGKELRATGEQECRFCEGRGWVLPVECCSCGRPGGQVVEQLVWAKMRKFVLCTREECVEKFMKVNPYEFEEVEDWEGWGV